MSTQTSGASFKDSSSWAHHRKRLCFSIVGSGLKIMSEIFMSLMASGGCRTPSISRERIRTVICELDWISWKLH